MLIFFSLADADTFSTLDAFAIISFRCRFSADFFFHFRHLLFRRRAIMPVSPRFTYTLIAHTFYALLALIRRRCFSFFSPSLLPRLPLRFIFAMLIFLRDIRFDIFHFAIFSPRFHYYFDGESFFRFSAFAESFSSHYLPPLSFLLDFRYAAMMPSFSRYAIFS